MNKKNWGMFLTVIFGALLETRLGWNALGHELVAQIACDQLTDPTLNWANDYNQALSGTYPEPSLVEAAPWLDTLRGDPKYAWLTPMHFIDLPYSEDGTPTEPPKPVNAVTAINDSVDTLTSTNQTDYEKGFYLRILLHVVGDIHQPLHTTTGFSKEFPNGDEGGNLVLLPGNPVAKNLHAYWDAGGGYLKDLSLEDIRNQAKILEKNWPCESVNTTFDPMAWAEESHAIAIGQVYDFDKPPHLNSTYNAITQDVTKEQLAKAGCRLAQTMNQIKSSHERKPTSWWPSFFSAKSFLGKEDKVAKIEATSTDQSLIAS